jgi:hypothetical protein
MRVYSRPGFRPRLRSDTVSAYCARVMSPFTSSACSTSSRRASAFCGAMNGSNADGACGSPARSAAWPRFRFFASFEKYVCAAASIP